MSTGRHGLITYVAGALAFTLTLVAAGSRATVAQSDDLGGPIIQGGREAEVSALFAPYWGVEDDGRPWEVTGARIEMSWIECDLVTDDGGRATLRLDHPSLAVAPTHESASFALTISAETPAARAAAETLVEAVRQNDTGVFWDAALHEDFTLRRFFFDGLLWCLAAALLLVVLTVRRLHATPRWVVVALLVVTVVGGVLRLLIAPDTTLGVWPYSRMITLHRYFWFGRSLPILAGVVGWEPYYTDAIGRLTWWFAAATPLALYCHASQLLDSRRAGLIAAGVLAVLPMHIRFSASEVAFIPSIALSSLTFAVVHSALKEPATRWRWFAWVVLPPLALLAYTARPLNVLFAPLMIATALFLAPPAVSRGRRIVVALLVAAPALVSTLFYLRVHFAPELSAGADPVMLLRSTFRAFFSLRYNTLIRPEMTPPLLLLAGILGAAWGWRAGRRALVVFLLSWLGIFFATHTFVMPNEVAMQARYHLHLVAPFVLLATLGLDTLLTRRPRIAAGVLLLVALSPLVHAGFIRDIDFDDQREFAFVREMRSELPDRCTILELSAPGAEVIQHRFGRLGLRIVEGARTRRFDVVEIGAPVEAEDPLLPEVRALLRDPPECLLYYQGLQCWSAKLPDEEIAPACDELARSAELELIDEVRFPTRIYNAPLSDGYGPDLEEIHLAVYRIR